MTIRHLFIATYLCTAWLTNAQDNKDLFDSLQNIIKSEMGNGTYDFESEAIAYETLAIKAADTLLMAKGMNFRGIYDYFKGRNTASIAKYLDALKLFHIANDTFYIAVTNNNIGAAYALRGSPDKSIIYYKDALKLFETIKDTFWMANIYNNIAIQNTNKQKYEESISYFDKAFSVYAQMKDSFSMSIILVNNSFNYLELGQTSTAKTILDHYFKNFNNNTDKETESNALAGMARIYMKNNELIKAEQAAQKSFEIRKQNEIINTYPKSYLLLSEIHERKNDFAAALDYHKLFSAYSDSIWVKEKDQNINELMTQYNVERKEKEIAGLSQENELKTATINQLYAKYKLYLGGLFLLFLSTGALSNIVYFRSKVNTELKNKNEIIAKNLSEKEILLKEIHHRVKNNLQVVSSLLNLQSNYIVDDLALEAINEGKNRVSSMALIHQNLYTDDDITTIETQQYFSELIDQLFESYNIRDNEITLVKNIQSLKVDVDKMVPLGLIANELISNALKHAFEAKTNGVLTISLFEINHELHLSIRDNGKGLDQKSFYSSESFGNKMIDVFVKKLEASLDIYHEDGTEFILKIKDYKNAA